MAPARKRWLTEGLGLGEEFRESSPIDFPPPVPGECRGASDSIVFCGPPPVVASDSQDGQQSVRPFPVFDALRITPRKTGSEGRQRSAGWLGSIVAHAAIVLLVAFLVVPADFGGLSTQTLVVTLSDEVPEIPIPMMLVEEIATEDASLLSEVQWEPEAIQPVEVSLEIARPTIKIGGSKTKPGQSTQNAGRGSRGSFFGIEAVGQDFVYVVDRSGSMNGVRYRRAISELRRSVSELRDDQRFFVVLFSSASKPMFGSSQALRMMNATQENKSKLDDWLATIGAGGGTNPNSSLRMAMKMKPNAVFMLSDGEFTDMKTNHRGGLLQPSGDAFSIVQAAGGTVPVHAIAFEDPRSCENMKRLAKMTGGEYRFVNSSGKTQSQLLAEARDLVGRPQSKSRTMDQNLLVHQFGSSQVTANAKRVFANLLIAEHEASFGEMVDDRRAPSVASLDETIRLLDSIVSIDPRRRVCADLQDKVAGELSRMLHRPSHRANVEQACDQLIRMPRSDAAVKVLDRLVDHFESLNLDQPNKAFARLRTIKAMHPNSQVLTLCQATCDKISEKIVEDAKRFLEKDDLASAIKMLRQTQMTQSNWELKSVAQKALYDLTTEQLIVARNASLRHDMKLKDKINEQLQIGFENDPQLAQWRRKLGNRELHARRSLQQVGSGNAYSGLKLKRQQLESIVQKYPETIAARLAKEQLKQFPKWEATRDKEEAELIRMMDDTRRR